jgi:hypothetical protein
MTGPIPGTTGLEQPAQFTLHAVRTAGSFGALDVEIFSDLRRSVRDDSRSIAGDAKQTAESAKLI